MMRRTLVAATLTAAGACAATPAIAQVRLDRADPTITEQALPKPAPVPAAGPPGVAQETTAPVSTIAAPS